MQKRTRKKPPKASDEINAEAPLNRQGYIDCLLNFARRVELAGTAGKPLVLDRFDARGVERPEALTVVQLCLAVMQAQQFARNIDPNSATIREINGLAEAGLILRHWVRVFAIRYGVDPTALVVEAGHADSNAWANLAAAVSAGRPENAESGGEPPASHKTRDYIGASQAQRELDLPTYKAFKRWLENHSDVRTRRPRKNRLEIHAGDLLAAKRKAEVVRGADDLSDEMMADIRAREIERRKAQVLAARAAAPRSRKA
jgi:hypothetical protein